MLRGIQIPCYRLPKIKDAANNVSRRIETVYLFANQIPLIDMMTLKGPVKQNWLENYPCLDGPVSYSSVADGVNISNMNSIMNIAKYRGKIIPVINFSDPNDALTFWIGDKFRENCQEHGIKFTNVVAKNATSWFGLFADPAKAHGGHINTNAVNEILSYGYSP